MEDALRAVRDRVETVRDEELDRALARLEADGELSPERRARIEETADRIVENLLFALAVRLATLDGQDGARPVETVRELFET